MPKLDRESEIRRGNVWHVSDIMENNKEEINDGLLVVFMEYRVSAEKVARVKLLGGEGGGVEVEIVRDTRKSPGAITGRALGSVGEY